MGDIYYFQCSLKLVSLNSYSSFSPDLWLQKSIHIIDIRPPEFHKIRRYRTSQPPLKLPSTYYILCSPYDWYCHVSTMRRCVTEVIYVAAQLAHRYLPRGMALNRTVSGPRISPRGFSFYWIK